MLRIRLVVVSLVLLAISSLLGAREKKADSSVIVPTITLREKLPLSEALKAIQQQTDVPIKAALGNKAPVISLDLTKASFWQAIDAVSVAAKARAYQSSRDGSVTLRPMGETDRRPPVSDDGPFQVRLTNVTTSRDLSSAHSVCVIRLDVRWTPTLRPLFLASAILRPNVRDEKGQAVPVQDEGGSLVPVDGRFSSSYELTFPAPARNQRQLASLQGRLYAVAPTKMIRFDFDADLASLNDALPGGAQRRAKQDGVVCRITKIVIGREAWSVQVALDYPEGNRKLESFQQGSMVANNRLTLVGKKNKTSLSPTNYLIDEASSRRTVVTYHFADAPRRGRASDWNLAYVAPAKIVEVPFRFSFENIPLP